MMISVNNYGVLRLHEAVRGKEDVTNFEKSISLISALYNEQFRHVENIRFFDCDFMKSQNVKKYFSIVETIVNLAEKYNIFLDRPNDPLCCLILGIFKTHMPQKVA